MILVLEPREQCVQAQLRRRGVESVEYLIARRDHTLPLLEELTKFLGRQKVLFSDLEAVGVVGSAGTFTTMRLAVSLLNTLSWLYGTSTFRAEDSKMISRNARRARVQFLTPHYSSKPNISRPKH